MAGILLPNGIVEGHESLEAYRARGGYTALADALENRSPLELHVQAPFAEQTIVHGGLQSMPLDYNNVNAPFYSEAECDFATAQDWTVGDLTTLVVFVRGRSGNAPTPLYLAVKDASNHTATVTYPDATVVSTTRWTEWKILLSDWTGVNLAKVKKITIGLGDRADLKPGGAGLIYIDDIRVTK